MDQVATTAGVTDQKMQLSETVGTAG